MKNENYIFYCLICHEYNLNIFTLFDIIFSNKRRFLIFKMTRALFSPMDFGMEYCTSRYLTMFIYWI